MICFFIQYSERIQLLSKITEELIYHGRILDLAREVHSMPDDRESSFEIVHHPGGAAALPVLEDGRLLLIRQFRPAIQGYIYEIPAGRLEVGETPSRIARFPGCQLAERYSHS